MARTARLLAWTIALVTFLPPASSIAANAASGQSGPRASAVTVTAIPRVGAVFFPSFLGSAVYLGLPHECSASVVHSPGHDLVLTAAHCIAGNGVGYDFVPEYHDRLAPLGIWSVQHAYVDPQWTASRDPQHDYAFLVVAPRQWHGARHNVEDVTGAFALGAAPAAGSAVMMDGYVAGVNDRPITCTAAVYYTAGFPSLDCDGFANGTSGGPFVQGGRVVGVIGGLHQGGCTPSTSYSAAFGADTLADWYRAAVGAAPNFVPLAGSDGC